MICFCGSPFFTQYIANVSPGQNAWVCPDRLSVGFSPCMAWFIYRAPCDWTVGLFPVFG